MGVVVERRQYANGVRSRVVSKTTSLDFRPRIGSSVCLPEGREIPKV
jgi:hypothetical protein